MAEIKRGTFYAPQDETNPRPMTFERDRKIVGWGDSPSEHQAGERARKQHSHMTSRPDLTVSPKK